MKDLDKAIAKIGETASQCQEAEKALGDGPAKQTARHMREFYSAIYEWLTELKLYRENYNDDGK